MKISLAQEFKGMSEDEITDMLTMDYEKIDGQYKDCKGCCFSQGSGGSSICDLYEITNILTHCSDYKIYKPREKVPDPEPEEIPVKEMQIDDHIKMMCDDEILRKINLRNNPYELGDLACGLKIFSTEKTNIEWYDYPRYKVVAFHMNGIDMFMESLTRDGKVIDGQLCVYPMHSDQIKKCVK